MATKKNGIVVGVFKDRSQAEKAIDDLRRAGFRDTQIGIMVRDGKSVRGIKNSKGSMVEEGALGGAAVGLGAGALAGLAVLSGVIPAIGPALFAGWLGSVVSSAGAGVLTGGLIGSLIGLGIPEEDAAFYEKEFKAGRTIVTVKNAARADEARTILQHYEGYDAAWHREQKTTTTTTRNGRSAAAAAVATTNGEQKVELKEEELRATKQQVKKGEVRVRKEVVTEHKTLEVPVTREEVVVERRPVRGRRAAADLEGSREIRIPVTEEQVTIEKTPVVKEEVVVGKRKVQDMKRVGGNVRHEEIRIEETGNVKARTRGNLKV